MIEEGNKKNVFVEKTMEAFKEFFNPALIIDSGKDKYYKISFLKGSIILYIPEATVNKHKEVLDRANYFFGDIFFIQEGFVYIDKEKYKDHLDDLKNVLRYEYGYKDESGLLLYLTGGKDIEWIIKNPSKVNGNYLMYKANFISIAPRYYSHIIRPDHVVKELRGNFDFGLRYVSVPLYTYSPQEKEYFESKINGYLDDAYAYYGDE